MPAQDVKLASTEELVTELKDRFEHLVIGGIRTGVKTKDDIVTLRRWKGDCSVCSGLCSQIVTDVNLANRKEEQNIKDY